MSKILKINVNDVKAALELILSFRSVPLDSVEWVDNAGMIYAHPKEEAAQEAGQGWWPLEDWKFMGLNNTSYFEQFIEPYIQVPESSVSYARETSTELGGHPFPSPTPFQQINFCLDPEMVAARQIGRAHV